MLFERLRFFVWWLLAAADRAVHVLAKESLSGGLLGLSWAPVLRFLWGPPFVSFRLCFFLIFRFLLPFLIGREGLGRHLRA